MVNLSGELKVLLQKSGNRCAFPGCGQLLTTNLEDPDDIVILSNIAHIVSRSEDGPRGRFALPMEKRDLESNLLLLCQNHHKLIDDQPQRYPVERLRGYKEDHEKRIEAATGNATVLSVTSKLDKENWIRETVYSTLFEILKLPVYVFESVLLSSASKSGKISQLPTYAAPDLYFPYIARYGKFYTFQDPSVTDSPFIDVVDLHAPVKKTPSRDWWVDTVKSRWFVELLNLSFRIFMEQKGLVWDDFHSRYYFSPDNPGKSKEISYRPLNKSISSKQVVWQPITKKTGQPKRYWLHRAVSTRFLNVTPGQWCLSLRPEFRVTKDGYISLDSKYIGSKVTKKKSKMFNYDLLGELNFWRSYLSKEEPRIILRFGTTFLAISSSMLSGEVIWPGIPEKYAKTFTNVEYAEDLFTWAKLQSLLESDTENVDMMDDQFEDYFDE